ncbi:MAG TPA: ClbS/DfsB family four-helix bundle protein, partial [Acidobacteriota bacterium]|nr:ClbS/DfsB family four-helix bundle protein [Acidobacteriota bacterium]
MPIPTTRQELIDLTRSAFEKLRKELDAAGPGAGEVPCVENWSVKDLLAVRAWWTKSVIDWIEEGQRGETPVLPAQGYRWNETPRLNNDLVSEARDESYDSVRGRLEEGYQRVMRMIDSLDDRELLEPGVFEWAGKYPISRWISINTARQYTTAR